MTTSRAYRVGPSTITILFGDITTSRAEVIVSSDDFELSMGGGVSEAISTAGGQSVAHDAAKLVPASAGDVVVTTAGRLPAKYLFHAITIGPGWQAPGPSTEDAIVRQICRKAMELLSQLGCRSIAFPALGTGVAGIRFDVAAAGMAATLVSELLDASEPYQVELYLHHSFGDEPQDRFFIFLEQFAARTLAVVSTPGHSATSLSAPEGPSAADEDSEEARDTLRRQQIFTMLRHLDARRTSLETSLIDALGGESGLSHEGLAHLTSQLTEIQELRRVYEDELAPATAATAPPIPNSVFLSSTFIDLKPHRDALRELIGRLGLTFIGMEDFLPAGEAPGTYIRKRVNQADAYVGIIGKRYGFIDPTSGLSMTELEYRQAVVSKKPIYMFVMGDRAMISASMVERDPEGLAKLNAFADRVQKSNVCGMFDDIDELVAKTTSVLHQLNQA
ncbi:MAG: DUF4062 domain-containing protein [Chloroflexota bacterium]